MGISASLSFCYAGSKILLRNAQEQQCSYFSQRFLLRVLRPYTIGKGWLQSVGALTLQADQLSVLVSQQVKGLVHCHQQGSLQLAHPAKHY